MSWWAEMGLRYNCWEYSNITHVTIPLHLKIIVVSAFKITLSAFLSCLSCSRARLKITTLDVVLACYNLHTGNLFSSNGVLIASQVLARPHYVSSFFTSSHSGSHSVSHSGSPLLPLCSRVSVRISSTQYMYMGVAGCQKSTSWERKNLGWM